MNFITRVCPRWSSLPLRNFKYVNPTTCGLVRCESSSSKDVSKLIDCTINDDFDTEAPSPYSDINYDEITNGDPDKLKALKLLQLEVDLMRQQGEQVPSVIAPPRWKDLLQLDNTQQITKYLRYLWVIEVKDKNRKIKSEKKSQFYMEQKAEKNVERRQRLTTDSPVTYSLIDTSLFFRIRDTDIHWYYNYKLFMAEWLGPTILVDCSYEPFMNLKNLSNCVKQMLLMWSENREHFNPYNLLFCNVNENGILWSKFRDRIPLINEEVSPVNFTSKHYLEMFPKNKLVYLTPHCSEVLHKFNHDDIYIIGCFVDNNQSQPVSLAKAKKEGLRMAKLPLDEYLQWAVGHKSLTLNQVIAILNDVKDGQSWPQALKHVPKRKIHNAKLGDEEDEDREHLRFNPRSGRDVREDYRKNLIYDLLLNDK